MFHQCREISIFLDYTNHQYNHELLPANESKRYHMYIKQNFLRHSYHDQIE